MAGLSRKDTRKMLRGLGITGQQNRALATSFQGSTGTGGGGTLDVLKDIISGRGAAAPYMESVGIPEVLGAAGGAAQLYNYLKPGNGGGACGGMVVVDDAEDMYYETACGGTRARSTAITINPESGSFTFWKNRGQPMLWTGDAATCKRVRRVAGKAYRSSGGGSRKR